MSTDFPLPSKKRSHKEQNMDNNFISSHHTSIKRRKILQYNHQSKDYYNQKENHPFTFSHTNKPSNPCKQSLKPSNSSYLNTCSPFQPSPINTAFQKLNEFWSQTKDTNPSQIENKCTVNWTDYNTFDFNSLLKSLTKDFEEEKEREEFNNLAEEIEQLNINLSAKQIQKIIADENEINDMIQKIKQLNIKVNNNENNKKMFELLNKLSELTIDCNNDSEFDCDSDQFDTCDQIETEICNDNTMGNNGNINDLNDINIENDSKEFDNKKHNKLKGKSIVHKCAKFMLSMLMVGAPVFYYYVS